jgi:hypothetical protein
MSTKKIETETYAILSNIDWSITKINSIIRKDGYEFICVSLNKLELDFSEVFNISREFKPKQNVLKGLDHGINVISEQFEGALKFYFTLSPGYENQAPDSDIYLLKRLKNTFTEVGENYISIGESSLAESQISNYVNDLIRKLRLYKKGQIAFQGYFSIFKEERRVISNYKTQKFPILGIYHIEDSDIPSLDKLLNNRLQIPSILDLAIESFELAYETSDNKLRFVLLMIGLESIFNRSSNDPIKHIISRHLALTLAENEEEFKEHFVTTKKLYDTRCKIVHGNTDKKIKASLENNIAQELKQLEDLTRKVIIKILWLYDFNTGEPTKDSLFEYLNKKGFEG